MPSTAVIANTASPRSTHGHRCTRPRSHGTTHTINATTEPHASAAPTSAATTISSTNGSWI